MVWADILHGDVVACLGTLPSASADLAIADPDWQIRGDIATGRKRNKVKFTQNRTGFDWWRPGDPTTRQEQDAFTRCWVGAVERVLRPGGHLLVWYDAMRISKVYEAAEATWTRPVARQNLFWQKAYPVPRAGQVNFCPAVEVAAWITKDSAAKAVATFNAELGQSSNIALAPQVKGLARVHPAQKPDAVLEWIVSYLSRPGDTVLDLFAGSFALTRVATECARNVVAVERDLRCFGHVRADIPGRTLRTIKEADDGISGVA